MEREFCRLYEGGPEGILLLHGFGDSPKCLTEAAEHLQSQGFTVSLICLSGHCTTMEDMKRFRAEDWVEDAECGWRELSARCETVHVGGISMGACLSAILAARHPVKSVSLTSMPVWSRSRVARVAAVLWPFYPYHAKGRLFPPPRRERRDPWDGYNGFYTRTLVQLNRVMKMARKALPQITCPVFISESGNDHAISQNSIPYIRSHLGSGETRYVYLADSPHVPTRGPRREEWLTELTTFYMKKSASGR